MWLRTTNENAFEGEYGKVLEKEVRGLLGPDTIREQRRMTHLRAEERACSSEVRDQGCT